VISLRKTLDGNFKRWYAIRGLKRYITMLGNNTFVIGDPHGCYESVIELLLRSRVNIDAERVFFVGDIIDKGPDSLRLLRAMEFYGWESIQGNHENKNFRLARGNKVKINPELADTQRQLGNEYERYGLLMGSWPYYMPFEDDQGSGYVVHGGVSPDRGIEEQDPKFLMMLRTWPFEMYVKGQPATQPPWQMAYTGHLGTILHGHIPSASIRHSGETLHNNPFVYSLDGGCVYGTDRSWGGELRGMRLGSREVFAVPGRADQTAHYNSL